MTRNGVRIGSEAHKELFCRMFLDSFDAYEPAVIDWPGLDGAELARLTGLPFWGLAVETESETSMRMQCLADVTEDPLIREAIALNAFEERRHKEVLEHLIRFYGIEIDPQHAFERPRDPEWAFIQTGYGECFDSFFAFGLFRAARDSGFFPPELVEVFEPVIQEEARHILFFINWLAYTQANRRPWRRPPFLAHRALALAQKAWNRLCLARQTGNNSSMTMGGHESMGIELSPRAFMELCLAENGRRMAAYDARLLRPLFMPRLVRATIPFTGRSHAQSVSDIVT